MRSPSSRHLPEWDDDWQPPRWNTPSRGPGPHRTRRAAPTQQAAASRPRATFADRPREIPQDLLQLAAAPFVTALLAAVLWLLTPLPGAGPSPAPLFIIALVQIGAIFVTRDDRPAPLHLPWLTHLAATVGLLPLLAIQVSLLREPYVALSEGSAWPVLVATIVALGFAIVLALATAVRFWRQPDQASLVFLPAALLIPAAIGQRAEITISRALAILAIAMFLGAVATVIAAPMSLVWRLVMPPLMLGAEIILLWIAGYGPVFHETSGSIVRVLYLLLLFAAIVLVIVVPLVSIRLRRSSASLPPPPAPGV
ncbi:MAG: hypothetical protein IT335_14785, partial [Thermomicrobiales bacterium]|nr:hypothetical protein [Thermomicrobiales bacterium]